MFRKLNCQAVIFVFFSLLFFFSWRVFAYEDHPRFCFNLWESAQKILYYDYEKDSSFPSLKQGIIDTSLPGGSHLSVRGRKVIGVKYTHFNYLDPVAKEDEPTSTTEIEQKLQVQVRGKIGEKISVNVDYDDTLSRSEQQKISLIYQGEEDEIIQEIALGDLKLALPKTEFTSYSKSLFGARLKARWKDFYLTALGSVTRGISDVKTFTGKTTSEEREIPDTAYIKRTYFKFFFDQEEKYPPEFYGPFSYTPGTVQVWIDDQDGSNNESSTWMEVTGVSSDGVTDSYSGWFDLQYPGQDYTVDYPRGVIKFNKSIGENFVIALSYKDAQGESHPSSGYYMIMKGQDEKYYRYRLWNYYYLGSKKIEQEDFVFQIKDLSGNIVYDWENPDEYPDYEVSVDFDFGIVQVFKFTTPITWEVYYRPFCEAYPPSSLHRYTLAVEYTHTVEIYLLHPDVVPDSERVYVDGKLLKRDEDYIIDYPSGYLSFVNPDLITSDTQIRVEYEWMPVMGGEATFLGGRVEYRPGENFSFGSTFLSQAAAPLGKIPSLGSSPASHQVWEADLNFKFKFNPATFWGKEFPVETLFAGEVSESNINPNTFGAAMLEDFSTSKVEDNLSVSIDNWKAGSEPPDVDSELREWIEPSNEEIAGDKINPSWSSDEIQILRLDLNFASLDNWDSIVYPLSITGNDYSGMKYLELWCKGIPEDAELFLDIGLVSEDVDGDGILDTEDKNRDGILNPGEDTGIMLYDRLFGADNGKLDTEDLDQDGVLDTAENFSTYLLSDEYKKELSTGWCKYTVPLNSAPNWDLVKTLVKHIRLWVKGSFLSASIRFGKISISGDRWEVSSLTIKGVNNYDDPDFPNPLENANFRSYYEKMFGDSRTSEGKWQKESALFLSGNDGYIQQTFISARNFTDYTTFNFWLYQEQAQGELYIRVGPDVETKFYQITLPLTSETGWKKISLPLCELEMQGDPVFSEIKQIRIGVRETSFPVHIYINDIYLDGVLERAGKAQRYILKSNLSKYATFFLEYKKINPPFAVIGASSTDEEIELKKWGMDLSLLEFLPFSYSGSEQLTRTLERRGTDLSLVEKDKKLTRSHNYQLGFRLKSWPKLTFKGSNITTDYLSQEPLKITTEDTYDLSLNYPVPLKSPFLPTDVSASFQLKKSAEKIEAVSQTFDVTRKKSITLPFQPFRNLTLKTSYSDSETNQKIDEGEKRPLSRSKDFSLQTQLSFLKLNPRAEFKGGSKEEDFSSENPRKRKLSTYFNISSSLPVRLSSLFQLPKFLSTLNYYLTFNLKQEGIYEDTSVSCDFLSQFGMERVDLPDGTEKLWLKKRTFNLKQTWQPLSFLNTTVEYGKEEEDKTESGTPFTVWVESWPVARFKFKLNRTPLIKELSEKLFSSSDLTLEYSRKITDKKGISTTTSHQPLLSWRGRFKKPESLSLVYSYKSSIQKETPFAQSKSGESFSSTHELKLSYSTYLPWGMKIPLLNRIINFENKINLSTTLTRELKFKQAISEALEEDNEKWTLTTDISYKLRDSVNMKLGVHATSYQDRVKAGEDYFSYGGSAQVEIVF